jgi:membrane associated rhomboid family serine protease
MTLIIVIVTSVISILAFYSENLMSRLIFNPYQVVHRKEWWRLLSHGFLHADWVHLIVNMIVLYSFGRNVESWINQLRIEDYIKSPILTYSLLYFGGIIISTVPTLIKQRNNYMYNSVGASGAVSAVVFTSIFFSPMDKIYFFGAIPIPGIIFAVIYLIYSSYMSRRGKDNINHDAHFAGAVFGFIFPVFIDFDMISHFVNAFKF